MLVQCLPYRYVLGIIPSWEMQNIKPYPKGLVLLENNFRLLCLKAYRKESRKADSLCEGISMGKYQMLSSLEKKKLL
jgi:hypothetical protein